MLEYIINRKIKYTVYIMVNNATKADPSPELTGGMLRNNIINNINGKINQKTGKARIHLLYFDCITISIKNKGIAYKVKPKTNILMLQNKSITKSTGSVKTTPSSIDFFIIHSKETDIFKYIL